MKKVIRIQDTFRPELPQVVGCRDYREQEELLLKVDRILTESGVEQLFTRLSLERYEADSVALAHGTGVREAMADYWGAPGG